MTKETEVSKTKQSLIFFFLSNKYVFFVSGSSWQCRKYIIFPVDFFLSSHSLTVWQLLSDDINAAVEISGIDVNCIGQWVYVLGKIT